MELTIPETTTALTTDWLTAALRAAGVLRRSAVTGVHVEVIGEEQGFTGVVARLQLRYDRSEPGAPASLVAKLPLARRAAASTYRDAQEGNPEQARRYRERCAREAHFYRLVASLDTLAPRAYAALADLDAGRILLLIEDLSHGEPGDALRGCTVDQARVVVEALARFHTRWWEHEMLSDLPWLPRWASDPATSAERYRNQVGPVLDRYGDQLPAGVRDLALSLRHDYEKILVALNGPPATMIHADLHLDNIIFTSSNGAHAAKVIDWQGVAHGSAAVDLSLFITGALEVDDRRRSEHDLLARYHQLLTRSGVTDYSFDRLLHDYRLALLWQLGGTIGWLSRVNLVTLAGRERALVEAIFTKGQLFAALQDHEVSRLIP